MQRAGTYGELMLEDTLVQDGHSYDDGLAGLQAGGCVRLGLWGVTHVQPASLPSPR